MIDVPSLYSVCIQNDTDETIPSYSVVVVTRVEWTSFDADTPAEIIHHVEQYGCGKNGNVLITGDSSIESGMQGAGYADPFVYVSFDSAVGLPQPGEEWGPVDDTWKIAKGGVGFFAQGHPPLDGPFGGDLNPQISLFLRNYTRAAASTCSSSGSYSSSSSGGSGSGSASGSSSGACPSGCIQVVTNVTCSGGSLVVTTACAMACPDD